MAKPKVHLHRDYLTSWCGRDISHIRATYEPGETSCAPCGAAYVKDAEDDAELARLNAAARIAAAESALSAAKAEAAHAVRQAEAKIAERREAVGAAA